MRLSDHFTLAELTISGRAARMGISNKPTPEILERLKITAAGMEKVRALLGHPITVSSGYRSPELNAVTPGSSSTSAHAKGWAVDFICPGFGTPLEVCRAIADSGILFDQIIHEYADWTHISFDPRMRGQLLTKLAGQDYTVGLHL